MGAPGAQTGAKDAAIEAFQLCSNDTKDTKQPQWCELLFGRLTESRDWDRILEVVCYHVHPQGCDDSEYTVRSIANIKYHSEEKYNDDDEEERLLETRAAQTDAMDPATEAA